jgi:hypothetical protein
LIGLHGDYCFHQEPAVKSDLSGASRALPFPSPGVGSTAALAAEPDSTAASAVCAAAIADSITASKASPNRRSVISAQQKVIVNITLRPTILYDNEYEIYSNLASELARYQSVDNSPKIFNAYKEWCENYIKRRLTPWKKFFYLQFHVASVGDISEDLLRSMGTVLTQNSAGQTLPGYQVVRPPLKKKREWGEKVYNMHITSLGSQLLNPRLSEVADLEEVFSAMRIPYSPPESDLLGIKYLPVKSE